MAEAITWTEIQREAEQRGYLLQVEGETVHASKKQFPHVRQSFTEHPDFSPDPHRADEYSLLQAFYWIRGYNLTHGDDGKVALHRGMHHPQYNQRIRVAETWDYFWDGDGKLEVLQQKMLAWMETVDQA
jgi:Fe-S-cluster formation regulator IscX/YfhJ